jgi:shikimate kinase
LNGIVLVGPRGSGKSAVGKALSECLGWRFVDADEQLQQRAGKTIRELFDTEGEAGFRLREATLLAELLSLSHVVLATGGGVVLRPENRAALRTAALVVWLQADAETLWQRIVADSSTAATRPNLAGGGLDEVRQVLATREPLYREVAHIALDTCGRSPAALAEVLMAHWAARS